MIDLNRSMGCKYYLHTQKTNSLDFGKNTSAIYMMGSGTLGAAMEAAIVQHRGIALSFGYRQLENPKELIMAASKFSIDLISHLIENWDEKVDTYSVNVPLENELIETGRLPVRHAFVQQNRWGSCFSKRTDGNGYNFTPNYSVVDNHLHTGSDAWCLRNGIASVTGLKATFKEADPEADHHIDIKST